MTWHSLSRGFERESIELLQIAEDMLVRFFEMDPNRASHAIEHLLTIRGHVYDEDMVHHEGPWRVAVAALYFSNPDALLDGFLPWMRARELESPHQEALVMMGRRLRAHRQ